MSEAAFRFYGDLNDFLPRKRKDTAFIHPFEHTASIKDMIESLGVPHPEIDLIVVNGTSVDFGYIVLNADSIEVYPFFAQVEIEPLRRLRPAPLEEIRFILDTHLGKLASHLRMLGFDTLYRNDYDDDELAEISHIEQRILLTRDLGVLKRGIVEYGYFVRNTNPEKQIIEIMRRYELVERITPFKRCLHCNGLLTPADAAELEGKVPPNTQTFYDVFHICRVCGKIYWKGSHHERMQQFIDRVVHARTD